MPLEVGQPFPSFALNDQHGQRHTNADFAGSKTVYYFYPKDDTSGCTAQACGFQESLPDLGDRVRVVGISPDPEKSHLKFANKYNLTFTLLADTETALCEACGVWVEKSMYGKKYMGVERTTFLVNADGIIEQVWNKVKPAGHAAEILSALS